MSYCLVNSEIRRARKEYRCIWCPEKIPVGQLYRYEYSFYDCNPQSLHWHPECHTAAKEWFRDNEEFEPHACKRGTTEER